MVTGNNHPIATDIETIVLNWLFRRGINFQFQTSLMGGFFELGGSVVDFLLPERGLAWRVQGEYFHSGVEKTGSDIIQKEQLESLGWTVVDLLGQNIQNNLEQTLRLALQGTEMLGG